MADGREPVKLAPRRAPTWSPDRWGLAGALTMDDDGDLVRAHRRHDHMLAQPFEKKIDLVSSHLQVPQRQAVDADWQAWALDVDLRVPAVDADPEAGLQQHERRTGGPGLRHAGDRIGNGRFAGGAGEAAEQFGELHVEIHRGFEDLAQKAHHGLAGAVARKA